MGLLYVLQCSAPMLGDDRESFSDTTVSDIRALSEHSEDNQTAGNILYQASDTILLLC